MSQKAQHPDDFANRFDSALARLQVAVLDACEREGEWADQVAAAIRAALRFIAENPAAARTLLVDSLAQGDYGVARRRRLIERYAELLGADAPEDPCRPAITELGVVGGIASLLTRRLFHGEREGLEDLAPDLIQFALTPYLATEEAKAQARRHRP
jgi:hypothetical protein